ncbi:hypothetical protein CIPAW_05G251300 [Carya illinoinensis]|uniref:CCT domain-containing protein n=2 Tax=Carya illinoinensis TaxID=32201 RepID=A0A8T1QNV4_CARIL|nr:hypothetical protein CIPAW_05G251300 [Carya illinoinensis]
MYADTEIMFPYFQNFSQEAQQLEEYCKTQKSSASMGHLAQTSILEYDLGGEGDLFKAPEPIIEEQVVSLDPMTAAISMIYCGQDVISTQGLRVADIESLQNEQLLSEVFYECRKDLLEKAAIEAPPSEVLDIKIPLSSIDEYKIQENRQLPALPFQKSVSSECLSSIEWMHGSAALTLGNGMSLIHSPLERPLIVSNCTTDERQEKLSRYRNKKTKRNFGRKIKYACRKALADSQPRVRGRFAKIDESDAKRQELLSVN